MTDWQRVPCKPWTGAVQSKGYGNLKVNGKTKLAHRVAYEEAYGPIPDGHEVDHLCRNTICCEPLHLEAVTHRENVIRGMHPNVVAFRAGTCTRGHDKSETYRRKSNGQAVYCRACRREDRAAAKEAA